MKELRRMQWGALVELKAQLLKIVPRLIATIFMIVYHLKDPGKLSALTSKRRF